jgi:hypothetical protein
MIKYSSGSFLVGVRFVIVLAALFAVPSSTQAQVSNTSTGYAALDNSPIGSYNTADGDAALCVLSNGSYNTGVGYCALFQMASGSGNTATGANSLCNNQGNNNTASGYFSMYSNIGGTFNTATGSCALYSNTSGSRNAATGVNALYLNITGTENTATGNGSLYGNTTGSYNTANGFDALASNTIGDYNTSNGYYSLYKNTTGTKNAATGVNSLYFNTTGSENTSNGNGSLYSNTTGSYNTAFGYDALTSNTTGGNNIALGHSAGAEIYLGSNNIDIGNTGAGADNGIMRIGTDGTHKETFIAGIHGVLASGGVAVFINANGQLGTLTSSRRFKFDIKDIGEKSDKLMDLRPVMFRYKEAAPDGSHPIQYGLIAEEVAKVYPDLVQYDKEGKPFTVYYHLLTPIMLNELQKAHHQVMAQQAEFTTLKATVQSQHAEVASLRRSLLSVVIIVPGSVIIGLAGLACITSAGRRRVVSWRARTRQTCA